MSDKYSNYPLKGTLAHYFTGPRSSENEFRTVPKLLRAVADWMEAEGVQDPEFDHLIVKTSFESDNDDEFSEIATVYYREETP